MKLWLPVLIATLTACQSDTKNLERKIDDLSKSLVAINAKVDRMPAGGGQGAGAAAGQQRPARVEPDAAKTYAVPIDGDPFDGPADAKVTVVKAYDYACPYCERVRGTMDQLRQKYGNDLRIVYKQLVVHPRNATAPALAYCAANRQGKAKEMDTLIWEKGFKSRNLDNSDVTANPQAEAAGQGAPGGTCWDAASGCPIAVGWAQELGLDVDKFKADMKGACQQVVQGDMRVLQQFGVAATPAFFINGRYLSGAQPLASFSAVIDEELKKANEKIQAGTPAAQYYQTVVLGTGLKQLDRP